jgi:hypothetical protein
VRILRNDGVGLAAFLKLKLAAGASQTNFFSALRAAIVKNHLQIVTDLRWVDPSATSTAQELPKHFDEEVLVCARELQ